MRAAVHLRSPFASRASNLVAIFSLLAGLVVAGVALLVGKETADAIRSEAYGGAARTAVVFTRLTLEAEEYSGNQITDEGVRDLRHNLSRTDSVIGITLWGEDRRHDVSLGHTEVGEEGGRPPNPAALEAALGGEIRTELVAEHGDGAGAQSQSDQMLAVYVPVVLAAGGPPTAVLQAHLPYRPVREEIAERTERLYLTVGGAALLLYLALLPALVRASRALARARNERQVALQRDLRRAIAQGELELHYQPKVRLADGEVRGVEALLRWHHPARGMVPPLEFLPQAERTPVMRALTRHIFRLACHQAAAWRDDGIELNVAVNLAVGNVEDTDLPTDLAEIVAETGVEASWFTLEVTETAAMERVAAVDRVLRSLRQLGFRLSIDDFGTGYSSLSRLHRLAIDEVKIDRSFVRSLDGGETRVTSAAIRLIDDLELTSVAEGIESADVARRLTEMGCEVGQGFHWTHPLPPDELLAWLRERPPS